MLNRKSRLLFCAASLGLALAGTSQAEIVKSKLVSFDAADAAAEPIVLKNDSFVDNGGPAYLQQGFIEGEKAGIFVKVPDTIKLFKVDYFRVLIGSGNMKDGESEMFAQPLQQSFFQMAIVDKPSRSIGADIENAVELTPGNYWNDVPAIGESRKLGCAAGGQYVAAALEFTHNGLPSVYRDVDGVSQVPHSLIYALGGVANGWQYASTLGVRGDWILRIVGHEATPDECRQ